MNYKPSPFESPTKSTYDFNIIGRCIVDANREARQLERDKEQYGEPKLVENENV